MHLGLKREGQLPGWAKADHGSTTRFRFQRLPHRKTVTLEARKDGDPGVYHYVFTRVSEDSSWRLQRAWRTDQKGRTSEDSPFRRPGLDSPEVTTAREVIGEAGTWRRTVRRCDVRQRQATPAGVLDVSTGTERLPFHGRGENAGNTATCARERLEPHEHTLQGVLKHSLAPDVSLAMRRPNSGGCRTGTFLPQRAAEFLKGCPLRCEWCHNPEGISHRPQVILSYYGSLRTR